MGKAIFGKTATGDRLERIKRSPNYRNGQFQNVHDTPQLSEDASYSGVICDFLFAKHLRRIPSDKIPTVKTDLLNLSPSDDVLVWFGHSSYFIQVDGKRLLVDPVFSGNASPIPGSTRAFKGTDRYAVDDLPEIDILIISHDHYDHMDYDTVTRLKPKVKKVVCGLGVGAHLEFWGYDTGDIYEKDWNETIDLGDGFIIHTTPSRHFSGRGLKRNRSLWMSYVLQTPSTKIFIGGDSGYDTHFAEIGEQFGPFNLVILENGQYNPSWKYIHMHPQEVVQAAKDLKAQKLLPVHSSKFSLATHPWDEPLIKVSEFIKGSGITLLTPMIGEAVDLEEDNPVFTSWWVGLQ